MTLSLQDLITTCALSLDKNDVKAAREATGQILALQHHNFLGHFFLAEINEREGAIDAALAGYALSLAIYPEQDKPFERFVTLAKKVGRLNEFVSDADVVIANGGPFHDYHFNGDTIKSNGMGGTESAIILVARELAKLGKRVAVFCSCDKPGVYDGVTYHSNRYFEVFQRLSPEKTIIACRNDHYLHKKTRAKKRILWIHDVANDFYKHLENGDDSRFDAVFCLSAYQKNNWLKAYPIPENKYVQTTNGFDAEIFFADESITREKSMVYVSRPSRGLNEAFSVFERLKDSHPDLKFKVCAYTHQKNLSDDPEWQPFVERLSLPGVVNLGELTKESLAFELKKSMLLVYPNVSIGETSCIAAIEAMACGTPVITSDRGALGETVVNGTGGVVVPYNEKTLVDDLVREAHRYLEDFNAWQSLSKSAANYARERYQWKDVVKSWLQYL